MNVLVSINKGYVRYFEVMLHSLLRQTERKVKVFIMHDDLDENDFSAIKREFPEAEFSFVFMESSLCSGFPTVKRYPYTVYYRIFAPALLPETVEKVLYLDCDLVLHNPIDEFYDTPFDGNYFVGCSHTGKLLSFFNRARLRVGKSHVYMNTGVVLMNVAALRDALDVGVLREYTLKNKRRLMLYDQDVICRFFGDRILEENSLVYNLSDRQIRRHNFFHGGKIDAEWVEKNNVIVHYIGPNKPWKAGYKGILGEYYVSAEKDFREQRGPRA
ncbi:MAG: glycosyltransferase family 8 protein [Clostridia bacterium]|nr:glycosyltransferase family 8 protein [Clostridia bacterium]